MSALGIAYIEGLGDSIYPCLWRFGGRLQRRWDLQDYYGSTEIDMLMRIDRETMTGDALWSAQNADPSP